MADWKLKYQIVADATKAKAEIRSVDDLLAKVGGGLSSGIGSLGPAGSIAAAGVAAIGAAAVTTGVALFNLAKNASDFGSEIKDFQDKTGLAAETITTLQFAAEQSGVAFESLGAPIAKFSKLVAEAQRGSEDAQSTLKEFGIDGAKAFTDLDYGIDAALTSLQKLPAGVQRTDAAMRLFGKSGKDVTGILAALDKDGLRATIEQAKKLGLTLDQEAIDAADEFGDTLGQLGRQAKITATQFAVAFMPEITDAMKEVSSELVKNKDTVKDWGQSVGTTLRGLKNISKEIYDFAQTPAGTVLKYLLFGVPIGVVGAINQFAGNPSATVPNPSTKQPGGDDDLETQKQAADQRAKQREAEFQKSISVRKERIGLFDQANRKGYVAEQKAVEDAYLRRELTEAEYRQRSLAAIEKYSDNVKTLLADALVLDNAADGKDPYAAGNNAIKNHEALKDLDREIIQWKADVNKTIAEMNAKDAAEQKAARDKDLADHEQKEEAAYERRLATQEFFLELGLVNEREYAYNVQLLRLEALESQRARETDLTKAAVLDEQIAAQKSRLAAVIIRNIKDEKKAAEEASKAYDAYRRSVWNLMMTQAEAVAQQREMIESLRVAQPMEEAMSEIGGMFSGAIDQWISGMGQIVEQWVLYGEVGPDAVKKMTAAVLAGLAAQAFVKALFYTAEGIVALFFDPPLAAGYFTAAAIMAGIAGGAALAGRAIAGDSFKKERGGSGSTSDAGRTLSGRDGGFGANLDKNPQTYSRQSENAFMSGQNQAIAELGRAVRELRHTVGGLDSKIGSMSPGEVMIRATKEKPGFIINQVGREATANAAAGIRLQRATGNRRG